MQRRSDLILACLKAAGQTRRSILGLMSEFLFNGSSTPAFTESGAYMPFCKDGSLLHYHDRRRSRPVQAFTSALTGPPQSQPRIGALPNQPVYKRANKKHLLAIIRADRVEAPQIDCAHGPEQLRGIASRLRSGTLQASILAGWTGTRVRPRAGLRAIIRGVDFCLSRLVIFVDEGR
jgi:hypothetical protein